MTDVINCPVKWPFLPHGLQRQTPKMLMTELKTNLDQDKKFTRETHPWGSESPLRSSSHSGAAVRPLKWGHFKALLKPHEPECQLRRAWATHPGMSLEQTCLPCVHHKQQRCHHLWTWTFSCCLIPCSLWRRTHDTSQVAPWHMVVEMGDVTDPCQCQLAQGHREHVKFANPFSNDVNC